MSNQWSTGLFDCFTDMGTCFCVWCCSPCAYGQIASLARTGNTGGSCGDCGSCCCFCFLGPLISCGTRKEIRTKYSLPEEPCADCLVHCFCLTCALCQEFRELKKQNGIGAPNTNEEMTR
eukprot:c12210_g1_i1.p1 GENE.c12210_g1_i1~~c12210_g1_i1.p1  ORF type:complete len:120 (+),score=19.48 c12210_g1_i1:62-421(+)